MALYPEYSRFALVDAALRYEPILYELLPDESFDVYITKIHNRVDNKHTIFISYRSSRKKMERKVIELSIADADDILRRIEIRSVRRHFDDVEAVSGRSSG